MMGSSKKAAIYDGCNTNVERSAAVPVKSSKKAAIYDGCNVKTINVHLKPEASSKKAAIYDGCNSPCILHRLRRCSRPLLRAVPGFTGERVYSLVIVPRPPLRHFPSGTAVIMVSEGSPGFWG